MVNKALYPTAQQRAISGRRRKREGLDKSRGKASKLPRSKNLLPAFAENDKSLLYTTYSMQKRRADADSKLIIADEKDPFPPPSSPNEKLATSLRVIYAQASVFFLLLLLGSVNRDTPARKKELPPNVWERGVCLGD